MAELDIEKLKRRPLTCRQGEPDCDYWAAHQVAIIAALEDRERLQKAMKLLLDASDILLTVTNESGDEDLTIDDWLRFGASRNAAKGALEGRD